MVKTFCVQQKFFLQIISKVAIVKLRMQPSPRSFFFYFENSFSVLTVILELLGLKKPTF